MVNFLLSWNYFPGLYKRVMGVSQNNILCSFNMNFNAFNVSQMSHNVYCGGDFIRINLDYKVDTKREELKMLMPAAPLQWQIREPRNPDNKWDVDLKIVDTNLSDMMREIDQLNMDCMIKEATTFLRITRAQAIEEVPLRYKSMVSVYERNSEEFLKVKVNRRTCQIMRITQNHDNVLERTTVPMLLTDVQRDDIVQVELSFMLYNLANMPNSNNTSIGCSMNVTKMWILPRRALRDEQYLNPIAIVAAPAANPFGGLGVMVEADIKEQKEEVDAFDKLMAEAKEKRKRSATNAMIDSMIKSGKIKLLKK